MQESCIHLFPKKYFGQLLDISLKKFTFSKHLIQNFHILKYGLQNSKTIGKELKIILVIN